MHDNFTCVFSIHVKFKIYFLRLNFLMDGFRLKLSVHWDISAKIYLFIWVDGKHSMVMLNPPQRWIMLSYCLSSFCPDKAVVNGLVCCNCKCIIQDHSLVIMQATNKKTEKKMLFIHLSWHASHCTMSLRIPLFESLIYYFFITLKHQTQQQSVLPVK